VAPMAFFISALFFGRLYFKRLWIMTIAFFVFWESNLNLDERRKKMIREAIRKVVLKGDLSREEMEEVMKEIMTGSASPAQIASFLTALRMKGETSEEMTTAAKAIKARVSGFHVGEDVLCLDREEITIESETILRTSKGLSGGTNIFNVSTATALVVAGGGLKVAKYGRKSASPLCGCADVTEALGINLDMTSTQLERCIKEIGICFIYEPFTKNGLRHIIDIREKIGIRTMFNLLAPLINPAGAKIQVLGVYEPGLTERMAKVLENLGIKKGLVVHGEDTLDEISITGETKVTEFKNGEVKTYLIKPEDFGMKRRKLDEIRGGTKEQNAGIILEILRGGRGARRDITVLNGAAAFVIAEKAKGFQEGIDLANRSIDSGEALRKLEMLIEFTNAESRYLRNPHEVETEREARGRS
jgi:anthranilate phosphoribosyltransferase